MAEIGTNYLNARRWVTGDDDGWRRQAVDWLRDTLWYAAHNPYVLRATAGLVGVLFVLFVATHVLADRIFPNVWTLGIPVGDLTIEEAEAALIDAWDSQIRIELLDQGRIWSVPPEEI